MDASALPSASRLEGRLEFEILIADTSARLMAAAPEQVDQAIQDALTRVREFFGADRCALLAVGTDPATVNVRLASYGAGVSHVSPDDDLGALFPWARHKLVVEREPVRVSRLAALPPEADADRRSWEAMGTLSNLTLPIETGTVVRHLIVIQTVQEEREWPEALTTRLRVLGGLVVGALQRKEMILGLREAEARVSLAVDSAEAGVWTLDCDTGVFWVTERTRAIFGFSPTETIDIQRVEASIHPDDRGIVSAARQRALREPEPTTVEYRIVRGDGRVRWVSTRGRPQFRPDGEPESLTGVTIDITERRRADEELADLGRRLIRAQEEERAMIARELHDDVTQRLAVLAIDAGRAELAAVTVQQVEAMRGLREELVRLSEDVHSLAYQLHSAVLEELGLVEALRAACERLGRRCGIQISLDSDPAADHLGRDASLCLFRVAQEALHNVARHSRGRSASVVVQALDGGFLLAIRDDGVGFDPVGPGTRKTLGMASMRERLRLVRGKLDVVSAPGQGTAVLAWVPAREATT
jgi:PAS domain S-box-containing protein